ncbi:MAG: LysR family transcriptional regulator [Rhodoferax sp.]|nr:LysR family transcriptional regulator [Rhodoferax sp.]
MNQIAPTIDPNDLVIFARVVELGSFSKLAEKFGTPKATISRRMAVLEAQLGERLLLRTTRRQSLTEFGELLLEHARQVASEMAEVQTLSERRQGEPSGRLRVSMPSDVANLLLPQMLTAFVALHPRIRLDLDLSARRVDLMGEGFDLALRIGALPDDSLLAARRLADLPNGLYASPGYLADFGFPGSPDALLQHKAVHLLGRNAEPIPWTLKQGDEKWTGLVPGNVNANSPELLVRMARAGAGIVAVPDFFATLQEHHGKLIRILPAWCLPAQTAWAVFPGRKLMPAKTRVFIDMLLATFNSDANNPAK